ncbi:mucoidy inhibitor MuiA family protein [Candidatus Thorarchaeota archaeon]|nr:MAG: mucoidy inhibitor MuiA family protein [Candidatus Thorarchaeota archaeon]
MQWRIRQFSEISVTELQTRISEVTIFRDGARIIRTGKKQLPKGPHKVTFHGITDYAHSDSFRVKGRGPAKLSSINVHSISEVFEPSDDVKPLHNQLKELKKKQEEVQDSIDFHNTRIANLQSMVSEFSNYFGQIYAANEGEIKQLTDMDKNSSKMALEARDTIRKLEDELEEINKQIEALRANISRISSERRTETTYTVEVSLDVSEDSNIELDVTYQTNNASWTPTYDIDLHPGKAKLRRMALLYNRTKEDWTKVKLIVSTATARPVEAIEATPYYVGVYDPAMERVRTEKRMMARAKAAPAMAPKTDMALAPPSPPPEIEEEFADVSETTSGIAIYEIQKPATIPSDNEKHPVTLTEEDLDSDTVHYWYAEGMAEVVAQDKVTNGDNVILLGKAKVYAEGDYIGETSLPQISPREPFKIGTRIAYDVKAEKKLAHREVEKAGVMRGKLRRSYRYRLEIQNFSKRAIEIDIFDRVPHSLSTQIEVKAEWQKLGIEKQNLGIIEWHKTLQRNQKDTIEYEYEVSWEKGVTVNPPLP